jgi:hypothetical protein
MKRFIFLFDFCANFQKSQNPCYFILKSYPIALYKPKGEKYFCTKFCTETRFLSDLECFSEFYKILEICLGSFGFLKQKLEKKFRKQNRKIVLNGKGPRGHLLAQSPFRPELTHCFFFARGRRKPAQQRPSTAAHRPAALSPSPEPLTARPHLSELRLRRAVAAAVSTPAETAAVSMQINANKFAVAAPTPPLYLSPHRRQFSAFQPCQIDPKSRPTNSPAISIRSSTIPSFQKVLAPPIPTNLSAMVRRFSSPPFRIRRCTRVSGKSRRSSAAASGARGNSAAHRRCFEKHCPLSTTRARPSSPPPSRPILRRLEEPPEHRHHRRPKPPPTKTPVRTPPLNLSILAARSAINGLD